MTDPPTRALTFLYRTALPDAAGQLFPRLLNDLCASAHSITSAELREDEIRVALDGHAFAVRMQTRCAGFGAAQRLFRPDAPVAGLAAARLGLAVLRHTARVHVAMPPGCPDAPATALIRSLCALHRPTAVMWTPGGIVLTGDEAQRTPLSVCAALAPGDPLPRPLPRYTRPGALPEAASRSVFACHRERSRSARVAPRKAARLPATAEPAPALPSQPDPRHTRRTVFGHDATAATPAAAAPAPATLRAALNPANDAARPGPAGAGVSLLPAPVCDGLILHGPAGGKRTIGTTLLALALCAGVLDAALGPMF